MANRVEKNKTECPEYDIKNAFDGELGEYRVPFHYHYSEDQSFTEDYY